MNIDLSNCKIKRTKKMTVTITPEWQEYARLLSFQILGESNISGLFTYFLNREKNKNDLKPLE